MLNFYKDEIWKDIEFDEGISKREKFKISNYGRILNCKGAKEYLVNETFVNGYTALHVRQTSGKSTRRYVHKLVAQHFLEQNDGIYVIHLNYDKTDNRVINLKWATKEEKERHQFSNPKYKEFKRKKIRASAKLTEAKVQLIKKKINDPNRKTRMKMIAKRFGISEMQLYRIKRGENWGDVSAY